MTLDEAILRAVTAIQMRQKKTGAWEFYGPRAAYAGTGFCSPKKLLAVRLLIAVEHLGVVPRSGLWWSIKKQAETITRTTKPLPPLDQLVSEMAGKYGLPLNLETEGD